MDDADDIAVPWSFSVGGVEHAEIPIDAHGDVRTRSSAGLRSRVERVGERGAADARQEITAIEVMGHGSLLEAGPRSGRSERHAECA